LFLLLGGTVDHLIARSTVGYHWSILTGVQCPISLQEDQKQSAYDCLMHQPIGDLAPCLFEQLNPSIGRHLSEDVSTEARRKKPRTEGGPDDKKDHEQSFGLLIDQLAALDSVGGHHSLVPLWSLGRTNRLQHHQHKTLDDPNNPMDDLWSGLASLEHLWSHSLDKCIDASPLVIVFGRADQPTFTAKEPQEGRIALVYVGSHSGRFEGIEIDSGKRVWGRNLKTRIESSAVASLSGEEVVVGGYDGVIYTLSTRDGSVLWRFSTGDQVKASPALDSSLGSIWCPSYDQRLYCLDIRARTCTFLTQLAASQSFGDRRLSAHHTRMLYVGSHGGFLFGFSLPANPEAQPRLAWMIATMDKPIFSSPAVDPRTGVVRHPLRHLFSRLLPPH
jgi:hypothetical protein